MILILDNFEKNIIKGINDIDEINIVYDRETNKGV